MASQKREKKIFLPRQDLKHDPLESKANVLLMSYAEVTKQNIKLPIPVLLQIHPLPNLHRGRQQSSTEAVEVA